MAAAACESAASGVLHSSTSALPSKQAQHLAEPLAEPCPDEDADHSADLGGHAQLQLLNLECISDGHAKVSPPGDSLQLHCLVHCLLYGRLCLKQDSCTGRSTPHCAWPFQARTARVPRASNRPVSSSRRSSCMPAHERVPPGAARPAIAAAASRTYHTLARACAPSGHAATHSQLCYTDHLHMEWCRC